MRNNQIVCMKNVIFQRTNSLENPGVGQYNVENVSLNLKKNSPKAVIGYQRRFYDPKS